MAEPSQEQVKTQDQLNEEQWKSPDNWGGPKFLSVYFSKKDDRVWVPKAVKYTGWTLNLAHKGGILWLVGICVGIILIMMGLTTIIITSILAWV
ncbi:MAG: DUF5808 domain-containing protein [Verrucomicrobiota bacterium]